MVAGTNSPSGCVKSRSLLRHRRGGSLQSRRVAGESQEEVLGGHKVESQLQPRLLQNRTEHNRQNNNQHHIVALGSTKLAISVLDASRSLGRAQALARRWLNTGVAEVVDIPRLRAGRSISQNPATAWTDDKSTCPTHQSPFTMRLRSRLLFARVGPPFSSAGRATILFLRRTLVLWPAQGAKPPPKTRQGQSSSLLAFHPSNRPPDYRTYLSPMRVAVLAILIILIAKQTSALQWRQDTDYILF